MRSESVSYHDHMMCGSDMKVIRLHRDGIELEMSPFTWLDGSLNALGKLGNIDRLRIIGGDKLNISENS